MRKIFGFMLGAITGGMLGAAAALLLTLFQGLKLRMKINDRIMVLQKEINDARIKSAPSWRMNSSTARS
jgi:gas vesicle protein